MTYTKEQIAAMGPEEMNRAIAEKVKPDLYVITKNGLYYRENAGGYTSSLEQAWKLPKADAKKYEMYAENPSVPNCEKVLIERAPILNYYGSLDAMHSAEETLLSNIPQWIAYERALRAVTLRDSREGGGLYERLIHATPLQRATAFLLSV